ncbi:unnamed protein product [Urochloa decumbens]|uniref:Protein TIFY n=1 Tax=Urochloa decumbens TaxID=240449 RepID=A0ABC9G6T7_9POAL
MGVGAEKQEELQGAAAAMAGRAPPAREKSSFAVTCSLLSQYLKDNKGGLQGLGGLGMAPPPPPSSAGAFRPPTTMNLLSTLDAPAAEEPNGDAAKATAEEAKEHDQQAGENPREEEEAQQLTIFYGGKVVVFDKFPSAKVKDLLQIVSVGDDGATAATQPSQNSLSECCLGFANRHADSEEEFTPQVP